MRPDPIAVPCSHSSADSTIGNSHIHKSVAATRFGFFKIVGQVHGQLKGKGTSLCIICTTRVEIVRERCIFQCVLLFPDCRCEFHCVLTLAVFMASFPFQLLALLGSSPTPDTEKTLLHRYLINIHNYIRHCMCNTFLILYCSKSFWFSLIKYQYPQFETLISFL